MRHCQRHTSQLPPSGSSFNELSVMMVNCLFSDLFFPSRFLIGSGHSLAAIRGRGSEQGNFRLQVRKFPDFVFLFLRCRDSIRRMTMIIMMRRFLMPVRLPMSGRMDFAARRLRRHRLIQNVVQLLLKFRSLSLFIFFPIIGSIVDLCIYKVQL